MNQIPEEYYQEIKKVYPSIQIDDIQVFDDGWDYFVCAVKDQHAFRFPRRNDYVKTLPRAVAFLEKFSPHSPILLPRMKIAFLTNGYPYVVYNFIKGVPFEISIAKTFFQEEMTIIAQQLGKFLTALHAFPLEDARKLGIPEEQLVPA